MQVQIKRIVNGAELVEYIFKGRTQGNFSPIYILILYMGTKWGLIDIS